VSSVNQMERGTVGTNGSIRMAAGAACRITTSNGRSNTPRLPLPASQQRFRSLFPFQKRSQKPVSSPGRISLIATSSRSRISSAWKTTPMRRGRGESGSGSACRAWCLRARGRGADLARQLPGPRRPEGEWRCHRSCSCFRPGPLGGRSHRRDSDQPVWSTSIIATV
jgi:hypothetical protein